MSKHLLLGLAVACHLALATLYAVTLPAHEGPDENDHCYYAYYLRSSGDLPIILKSAARAGRRPWEEASVGHHPPLYYALLAMAMSMLGDDAPAWRANPDWIGNHPDWRTESDWATRHPGAALHWLHGHDEVPPVSPEIGVLRWLRFGSVLLGAVSVVLSYALARLLFPDQRMVAGAAALLLACVPQWSMMHGCLDNGNLAAVGSHATLVTVAWTLRHRRLGAREGLLLGALCGLSVMAKLTAIFLVPLVGGVLAVAWMAWRDRRMQIASAAVITLVVFAALTGWTFARNATLYGDPLALDAHREAFASNTIPGEMRVDYLLGEFPVRAFRSGIGEFGWSILPVPSWVVAAFGLPLMLGWLCSLLGIAKLWRASGPPLLAIVAAVALAGAGFVRFNTTFFQPQGRYLFPVYGPLVVLAAAGLIVPLRSIWSRIGRVGALLLVVPPLAAAIVFAGHFAPAFAVAPSDHERWYASMVADLRTPAPASRATIRALEPADAARVAQAPTFRWDAPDHGAEARYSLHFYTDSGRVIMTTYEWGHVLIERQEWTFPAAFWKSIEADEPFYWKVRRLPDRRAGETVEDVPESEPRLITRIE